MIRWICCWIWMPWTLANTRWTWNLHYSCHSVHSLRCSLGLSGPSHHILLLRGNIVEIKTEKKALTVATFVGFASGCIQCCCWSLILPFHISKCTGTLKVDFHNFYLRNIDFFVILFQSKALHFSLFYYYYYLFFCFFETPIMTVTVTGHLRRTFTMQFRGGRCPVTYGYICFGIM